MEKVALHLGLPPFSQILLCFPNRSVWGTEKPQGHHVPLPDGCVWGDTMGSLRIHSQSPAAPIALCMAEVPDT